MPQLHRQLSPFGVLLLTLSALSPVYSIYGVAPDVLQHAGSGAVLLFLVAIVVAIVWGAVYAELASAYPYAGGDYVGVAHVLGPWAGFASLTIWAVLSGPSSAFLARTIATYTAQWLPSVPLPLVTIASLVAGVLMALLAVRTTAWITGIFLAIEIIGVAVLIGLGVAHPQRELSAVILHPMTLGTGGLLQALSTAALLSSAIPAAYATVGGNQAIGFGEELTEPHRHMGRVLLGAALIGAFATAIPVIAVVLGARDLPALLASPVPFTQFVSISTRPWVGTALSAAVILAIFNSLIATLMFQARLFFSLGRDEIFGSRLNRWLGGVHESSGAPRNATLALGAIALGCCALSTHILLVFTAGLVVYTFALVSAAVLVGRRRGLTGTQGFWRSWAYPLIPMLGLALALGFAIADWLDPDVGRPSLIILGLFIVAGLAWYWRVLRRRPGGWMPRLG